MVIDVETPFPPPVSGVISRVASSRQWGSGEGCFPQLGAPYWGFRQATTGWVCWKPAGEASAGFFRLLNGVESRLLPRRPGVYEGLICEGPR